MNKGQAFGLQLAFTQGRKQVCHAIGTVNAIKMATKVACEAFGLKYRGAVAIGYKADLVVLDNLENIGVKTVFKNGKVIGNLS